MKRSTVTVRESDGCEVVYFVLTSTLHRRRYLGISASHMVAAWGWDITTDSVTDET